MLPPGPEDPPERQSFRWFAAPYDFLRECRTRYGDPFLLRLQHYGPHVCVSDPEAIRAIFTAPPGTLEAGAGNDPLRPLLGDRSLLLLDGAEHRLHRKILTPAFQDDRVERSRDAIEAITDRALASWTEGRAVAVHPAMVRISLEVILSFVLGAGPDDELVALFTELLQRPSLSLKLFEVSDPIRARIDAILYERIRAGTGGLLDLMIGLLDEDAIRDELVTLIVAGHETTASSLAWATYFLLSTPEVLDRVRAGDRALLDAAVKETLRLRPVIPVVSRRVAATIEIAGFTLEPGMHVMPCIYLTHHRPELFPEPERFRPERFLGERPSPYAWLPFGGGARRCIGMSFALFEMQRVLARMFETVELELTETSPPRPIRSALMIVPSGGTRVRVKRRHAP